MEIFKIDFPENQVEFKYRHDSLGDQGVIKQIFIDQDYDLKRFPSHVNVLINYMNRSGSKKNLIIDAGANIGASCVFFNNYFLNPFVFAIEPDQQNYNLLVENTLPYKDQTNFHGAIASFDGFLSLFDPGHSDWGFRTKKDTQDFENTIKVPCISPSSILKKYEEQQPLVFKIDIEGAESELFSQDTDWIDLFPLIIIELHDWMLPFSGSSHSFLKSISKFDFDILHHGENIFLFNRKILKDFFY